MLASLVAYWASGQRPRAPRLHGGALGGGSAAHEARMPKGGPPDAQILSY
jgi:hypothetical protein